MASALVTGATGSLGKAIVSALRKDTAYSDVFPCSRHCNESDGLQLDVRDCEQLAETVQRIKPNFIFHLAATFSGDFDEAYALNVESSRHLLDAVQHADSGARVILIGSAAEYGAVQREGNPIDEEHVLNPVSVYGLSKSWQTQLAGIYSRRGVDVVVARVFNLNGPNMSEQLFVGRVQCQIQDVVAGRKSVIEVGSLSAVRDYVHIAEAAEQILAIAAHAECAQVYHVASGIPVTMRDILVGYLSKYNLEASIIREGGKLTNHVGYDVPVIYANISKTSQLLKAWRASVET